MHKPSPFDPKVVEVDMAQAEAKILAHFDKEADHAMQEPFQGPGYRSLIILWPDDEAVVEEYATPALAAARIKALRAMPYGECPQYEMCDAEGSVVEEGP